MTEPAIDPLADLRPNFAARLRDRVVSLSTFLGDMRQGTVADDAMSENHRCVHSMISSAAIFGHLELSRIARLAERAFEQHETAGTCSLLNAIENVLTTAHDVLSVYEAPRSSA